MTRETYRWLVVAAGAAMVGWLTDINASAANGTDLSNRIVVKDFMFQPASLTVTVGSTVVWANVDDEPHTVVSDTGLFRSGAMDTNESFSFKFAKPGTYHFTCSIHPRMVGTIVVQ